MKTHFINLTMSAKLSQKQIGRRIAEIRKRKGLSQEDLAGRINISRPSLAQIELGNRGVDILELQCLSVVLGFSLDEFMAEKFPAGQYNSDSPEPETTMVEERNSTPYFQVQKFKNVLLYILEKCAGNPNVGETVLFKLLYFSDFNYYELYEEHLTGATYRKLPFGPVPNQADTIINKMLEEGILQRIKTDFHGFAQTRYLPLIKADLTQLKASEKEVIDRVLYQMSDWSAAVISVYSHHDLPWEITDEGKDINYELAFYREIPYSARVYEEDME